MYNRTEVDIEKLAKRHQENFTIISQSGDKSVCPKEQHKEGRSSPNRDSNFHNKLQHS